MTTPKPWADEPFKLMHTPTFENDPNSEPTECAIAASWMALLHNGLIRGLNSIILQAPHVQARDHADFITYCLLWAETLNSHHDGEEKKFFPALKAAAGLDGKGLMDENIKQHESFHAGITAYIDYLTPLAHNSRSFDASRLLRLIDAFSPALHSHLTSEITSLLALSALTPPLPVLTIWKTGIPDTGTGGGEGEREGGKGSPEKRDRWAKAQHYLFFIYNHDTTFEEPLWVAFPEMSTVMRGVMVHGIGWWHWRAWKFASCDCWGRPRALYALGA